MPKTLSTISAHHQGRPQRPGRNVRRPHQNRLLRQGSAKNTPEHLFALGYSACFGSALQAVAGMQKKTIPPDFAVTVTVPLIMGDDHGLLHRGRT